MSRGLSAAAAAALLTAAVAAACSTPPAAPPWEAANPVVPLPRPPLGTQADFASLSFQVTPEKVRLGRWLFYDKRLSVDGSVSCASCHRPENAFSEPTPHSTGVGGKTGSRKAPTFINGAWPFYPVYFWDGRAASLPDQAKGPMINPVEMAASHDGIVTTVKGLQGYRDSFRQVWGDETVDIDRVAEAIAAYEATRMSGDSPWDRWKAGDQAAVPERVKKGDQLFFGKADCAQCHVGWNFTDSRFYNLGIGWDAASSSFPDPGRSKVSGDQKETGAFKTPTLRDVALHPPYMHDGSLATLRDVVEHYNKGGTPNPWLNERVRPLNLTAEEVDAVVAFMEALTGRGYQDSAPAAFPQ
ncbi:MAG TPA: cytochrome c peroxidase [Candidatus Polarisedimenticolia bacterium]|nr:cytochrome c peroxidase [Candidatus Polarisedimenticolia bacterium]